MHKFLTVPVNVIILIQSPWYYFYFRTTRWLKGSIKKYEGTRKFIWDYSFLSKIMNKKLTKSMLYYSLSLFTRSFLIHNLLLYIMIRFSTQSTIGDVFTRWETLRSVVWQQPEDAKLFEDQCKSLRSSLQIYSFWLLMSPFIKSSGNHWSENAVFQTSMALKFKL